MSGLKTMSDVTKALKSIVAPTLQAMLEKETEYHLGYRMHDPKGNKSGNSRKGTSRKKIKTSFGEEDLHVPRDRNGEFEPI
jgi:putative transposase